MKKKLAFVLGGGASRGAMQVGALRALLEVGYQPDLVTGTSIGATNAAFLAVNGFTLEAVNKLEQVWKSVVDNEMLPSHFWWQAMRVALPAHTRRSVHFLLGWLAVQVLLGIATLLYVVPIPLAAAHQAGALVLFSLALTVQHSLQTPH